MKVSGNLFCGLPDVPVRVQALETIGYDSLYSAEINNDPFFPLLLAAEHSKNIGLHTSITVALARNPMTLANLAHDLNQYSGGRFNLGLGSQIRPHITKRFSMPWSHPAARMREFILAMRAIWACWYDDVPLDFRGEFYQHTLMTPMFVPPLRDFGAPKVSLAAVGPRMTAVAGEVADGLIAHGFTTPKYLREVTLPALQSGLEKSGRKRAEFEIFCPIMLVTGNSDEEMEQSFAAVRQQISFYGSTPAYKPVLDAHGWGDLHAELNTMSKAGQWVEMGMLLTDEIVNTFAIVAAPEHIAAEIEGRYRGLVDTWLCTADLADLEQQRTLINAVKNIQA